MFLEIPFGEWLPDLPPHRNPGALEARNVIPRVNSYGPVRSLLAFTQALGARVLSAFWAQDASNTVHVFAGTATALYELQADGSWSDVSRLVGGAYTATDWEWVKFGEYIIATNQADVAQIFEMGVSSEFAALSGSPPQAARADVVRDFVVFGDLQSNPQRVHWSGFNNQTIWTGVRYQSDFQDLFGRGGRVQKIVGGESGVIFTEHSIWTMTYTGPPNIFVFREVETARGTPAPNSVVRVGDDIFFYAYDGFYVYRGGQTIPVGHEKVDAWFRSVANPGTIDTIRGAADQQNGLIFWAFSAAGSTTQYDRLLIYNRRTNRWAYAIINTECIVGLVSAGYNLDTLDTILTGGIDVSSIPVDSPEYQGGALQFAAFNTSHRACTFSGTPLDALVDTEELSEARVSEGAFDGRRLFVRGARPVVHGASGTVTVAPGYRQLRSASPTFATAVGLNSIGEANFRREARYQRMRVALSGEFEHAQGCEVDLEIVGRR